MAEARLSLILADYAIIFASELNRSLLPASLSRNLRKARFVGNQSGYYRHLLNQFAKTPLTTDDLPIAPLRGGSKHSLCADPCYLHPDRDQLLLFYRDLNLTREEAVALAQRIQPLLDDFGARLKVLGSEQWLLECESLPAVEFTAREGLQGLPVTRFLPSGPDATQWLRLWNEIQMLLFDCPENQEREAAGKVPINSVWFWGKGTMPAWHARPHVSGQHALLSELARQTGSVYQAAIDHFSQIQSRPAVHVVDFDTGGDWEQQLMTLNRNWLMPALSALKRWQLKELELIIPEWGVYRFGPLSSWRWWR